MKKTEAKRILIVEDDPDISRALRIRLEAAGYAVTLAPDAVMAMSAAQRSQPDLAILDISMPGGDGFEVAKRLLADPATADTRLIFITASKRPELRGRAAEVGARAFFEKPYRAEELLATIERQLCDTAQSELV